MTRSWLAAMLVIPIAVGLVHPSAASAQDGSTLAGRWTLNRELSQFPREVGFNADWMAATGSGGDSTAGGGSQGGAPGGGGRTSFPVSRVSREDSMRKASAWCSGSQPHDRGNSFRERIKGRPSIAFRLNPTDVDLLRHRKGFFVTPYGQGQWVSVWADGPLNWGLVGRLLERSHRLVALERMIVALDSTGGRS